MAEDATPTITFTPAAGNSRVNCSECGALIEPTQQDRHAAWHDTLRREAGTWVIPTGIVK